MFPVILREEIPDPIDIFPVEEVRFPPTLNVEILFPTVMFPFDTRTDGALNDVAPASTNKLPVVIVIAPVAVNDPEAPTSIVPSLTVPVVNVPFIVNELPLLMVICAVAITSLGKVIEPSTTKLLFIKLTIKTPPGITVDVPFGTDIVLVVTLAVDPTTKLLF